MEKIKVVIENKQKAVKIPTGIRLLMRRCCHAVLAMEHFEGSAQVDISLVDDEEIRTINREHRKVDAITDVLSFPMFELQPGEKPRAEWADPDTDRVLLGDMMISLEHVAAQAREYGHSNRRELAYLVVHSVLHLLGYDHLDEGPQKALMRAHEEAILTQLGIPRS